MNHYVFLPLMAFIINGFTWTYVYAQRKKDPTNRAYLILSGILGAWVASDFILWSPVDQTWLVPLLKFQSILWLSVGFWFLNFTYAFLKKRRNLLYYAFLVSTTISALVSVSTNLVIKGYVDRYWGVHANVGVLFVPLTLIITTSAILYSFFLLYSRRRMTSDVNSRNQFTLLLWGSSIPLITGLIANVVLPYILSIDSFLQVASSGTVIQSIFVFIAIVKYRFLSIGVEQVANSLFVNAQDGVIIVDNTAHAVRMNEAARKLLQLPHTEIHSTELPKLFKNYSSDENRQSFETEIISNGQEKTVSVWQTTVGSSSLELGKILIVKDVSELKLAQKTVRERTQELKETQEQLLRSERLAAIGQLAASVGHELRNPLGVIHNSLHLISPELKDADEKVKTQLDRIQRELRRSNKIISDLLEFSRNKDPSFLPTDLNQLIEEVLSKVYVPGRVEVISDLGDISTAMADGEQLQSVFINLISNGIQAMSEGGILTVRSSRNDRFVEVRISDTGAGIPEENLEKIFEPLFSTKPKGIGLGLCVTKKFIQDHGGTITVESKLKAGTTFIVRIPIERKRKSCTKE